MTDQAPKHVMTTAIGTDHSPFITETAKEDTLTDQDHTTNAITSEVSATFRGTEPIPHPITTAACDTNPTERWSR